jgi:hypothetical protein
MRVKTIFVAYPYAFGMEYRAALERRFAGSGIEFRYADDELANTHVMGKITRMMSEADLCFFDVTDSNANVLFELGYALGAQEPGFVVVKQDAAKELKSDIVGWDSLRYEDHDDLAAQLFEVVTKGRVPLRRREQGKVEIAAIDPREIIRGIRFGVPQSDHARLVIYAVPTTYDRHYLSREFFGKPPYRAQDLAHSIDHAINATHYETAFWPSGYDYDHRPGPDFLEVYLGAEGAPPGERSTNFRMYLSGAATYMQRLRRREPNDSPFLYLYMFEEIAEMAFTSIIDARSRWGFDEQREIAVGAAFLDAPDLRISDATRAFYPAGDIGRPLADPQDIVWIPRDPLILPTQQFDAKNAALEVAADLLVSLG